MFALHTVSRDSLGSDWRGDFIISLLTGNPEVPSAGSLFPHIGISFASCGNGL
jgi:hypothetical protein